MLLHHPFRGELSHKLLINELDKPVYISHLGG